MRTLPTLKKPAYSKDYARLIGFGLDTLEETYNLELDLDVLETLEAAKKRAFENQDQTPVSVRVGDEDFQIVGYGGQGGVVYIMGNESFLVRIRPKKDWPISLRYTSGGLWGEGYAALKKRALNLMVALSPHKYGHILGGIDERIKRADVAFDFYSEKFSDEMKNRGGALYNDIVAHSSVKRKLEGAGSVQTITIGSKQRLEVQLYDKGREIKEHSGKTWMFDLWEREGWTRPSDGKAKDVWRLECRFGKEFLRDRKIITTYEFLGAQKELVAEAIFERRLTKQNRDANRARWPLHPLWYIAAQKNSGEMMMPIGRRITMRRKALSQMLLAQAAGIMRARSVLNSDHFDDRDVENLSKQVEGRLVSLTGDRGAVERARERYKHVDDMK